jgi:hypothetical protein
VGDFFDYERVGAAEVFDHDSLSGILFTSMVVKEIELGISRGGSENGLLYEC